MFASALSIGSNTASKEPGELTYGGRKNLVPVEPEPSSRREHDRQSLILWELHELRQKARRPWLVRIAVPALVTGLAGAFGGYVFGDSLGARTRAEIRRSTLQTYFAVHNQAAGKRKQILGFIGTVLAKDDPDLAEWARKEGAVVDERLRDLEAEKKG